MINVLFWLLSLTKGTELASQVMALTLLVAASSEHHFSLTGFDELAKDIQELVEWEIDFIQTEFLLKGL
jgi:hypothetical protein